MSAPALVVGTAGHIDHGKTSLVRALTGVDLDSTPEEQARGITINLGFTPLDLPSGRRVGFVDVPGHERLVRTMIAGATGIDAVLLCVSAVDGAMPQTREHLAILDLLGVRNGAVVLTMADLVDDDMLELAAEDVQDAVAGTFLEGAPVVATSSVTKRGVEEVLQVVSAFPDTIRSESGPFRMPVDRSFSRPGFGTVATGTTWSGAVDDGSTVTLLPQGVTARVRGIEVHGDKVGRALPGRRTALNLAGTEQVPRGTVVTLGSVPTPQMVDVRYTHLAGAPPLKDGAAVRVLLGTAERLGRFVIAGPLDVVVAGTQVWAQLRLEAPLPCLPGDRFVVRRPSPAETLGGGAVVDPWAPKLRRRDQAQAAAQLQRLSEGDVTVLLERAGEEGLTPEAWAERGGANVGEVLGDRRVAAPIAARLQGALLEALAAYHEAQPLSLGAHRRELRRDRLAHLTDRMFDALLERLSAISAVRIEGPLIRVEGFAVALSATEQALRDRVLRVVSEAALSGVAPKKLHEAVPSPKVQALLRLLEAEGSLTEVTGIGWVDPAALTGLEASLGIWFGDNAELSPGDFKELTGLTRKAAIPLLEWLDRGKLTRRNGGVRVAGPKLR